MAAARFGIYTVAIAAFIVLMIKLRIVVSWLALVAGFAVFMLVLATMLFRPGAISYGLQATVVDRPCS